MDHRASVEYSVRARPRSVSALAASIRVIAFDRCAGESAAYAICDRSTGRLQCRSRSRVRDRSGSEESPARSPVDEECTREPGARRASPSWPRPAGAPIGPGRLLRERRRPSRSQTVLGNPVSSGVGSAGTRDVADRSHSIADEVYKNRPSARPDLPIPVSGCTILLNTCTTMGVRGEGRANPMLSIFGPARTGYCDGVTRRDFLKIGGLALGGLSLPGLLRAESQAGVRRSHKAVIMVFLAGGPPHQDMFDLKPDAPDGIRGEFRPIPTNVPGLDICEHMPRLARMMDKFVVIRSIVGAGRDHSAGQCLTGYTDLISKAQGAGPAWARSSRSCKGRCIPTSRRSSGSRRGPASRGGAIPATRATSDWPTPRSRRSAPRGEGEAGTATGGGRPEPGRAAIDPTRLAGRRSLLGQLDGFRRALRPRRSRPRAWTASPSGPSRCSPRGGSTRRSTSPGKTRGSAPATASAT